MKNIHILPTDKSSRLYYFTGYKAGFYLYPNNQLLTPANPNYINQNIYITFEEEIKDCWFMNTLTNEIGFTKGSIGIQKNAKKIIITTDQDLIKDGVQSVEEDFLYWFVKNPSCEEVKIENVFGFAEIIIPKKELKQEIKMEDIFNDDKKENLKKFIDEIKNPSEPNQALKDAAHRYEKYSERFDNDKSAIGNPQTWGKRLICKDCNEPLEDCTCIEDTVEFPKQALKNAAERYEKYSERFDNDESAIGNPETWGKRVLTEEDIFNQRDIDAVTDYIGKETSKQETLEEAAREYYKRGQLGFEKASDTERAFLNGAKWQQERSYSEEDMIEFGKFIFKNTLLVNVKGVEGILEQFKKK